MGFVSDDQALTETFWKSKALISRVGKDVSADGTLNVMGGTFPTLFLEVYMCDLGLSLFGNSFIFNLNNSK